ncbi:hypothetical protein CW751_01675 [Brumimicrobium salinarum]|uniref:Stage II sporulation protein M n=1 Tax=Brumimicrobium salinarum TaxID=2058658 RepID=A0A2I0R657_9FLAO|nr:stage II sporulation protein M [Brumimicrobium salinarum]PKR82072.1 hypothetical protein CW751_01675 [Brumimicrobium salinarum]
MKETEFIQQNKRKWNTYEKRLSSTSTEPEEIHELYTELNNDLSFAQTFYEKRTVRAYLNYLTQSIHRKFYKQKKEPFSAIWKAWTIDLPLEIYRARKNLLFALVLFIIYFLIGAFSTHQDIDFAKMVLGNGYVNLTEENIANGNPMGIYGDTSQGIMFVQITINNIQVALMCFFGGLLFSLGTHVILFKNAVMVGVFQYFFKLKGLLLTSFLTIWIHGAFEISAIIIASGAGFTLGHGLLFPGSYTRLQALQMSGMRGIRIMLSLIPIFVIAGFLESYVTRNYQALPNWSKWMIVLLSFGMIFFYYVIYPILVARKHPEKVDAKPSVNAFETIPFTPHKTRNNITIFRETFQLYRVKFIVFWKAILRTVVPLSLLIMSVQLVIHYADLTTFYTTDWSAQLSILFGNPYKEMYNGSSDFIISIIWLVPLAFLALSVYYALLNDKNEFVLQDFKMFVKKRFFKMCLALMPIYFALIFLPHFVLMILLFVFPFLLLSIASVGVSEDVSLKKGRQYGTKKWSTVFILSFILLIVTFFFAQPFAFIVSVEADLLDWLIDFLLPIFAEFTEEPLVFGNLIRQLIYITFLLFIIPLFLLLMV